MIGRQRRELAIESQTRSAAFAEAPRETTRSPHSAKKIRYTAEFFPLFFSTVPGLTSERSPSFQEGLGAFNDEASATHLLWDIEAAAGPQAAKAAGIVLGWCERGTMIADDNLRKS